MRIAQVAPLFESVPPQYYGGTERVVSYLTEELAAQGHEVTLLASGDSKTAARLVPICPRALRLDPERKDPLAYQVLMLQRVAERARHFDVMHFHIDHLHFPLARACKWPAVTTLHGRLDLPELDPLYDEFGDMRVVSISEAQRAPLPQAGWQGTVHHGLPLDLYHFTATPSGYFAFIGRISPEKGVNRAVEVARRTDTPLKIAAKVDAIDREYFEAEVEPLLSDPLIDYVGEIGEMDKGSFLGNARALLFPIDWPEPFGLVMIEALACGTPVIAFRRGSVPEVLEDGTTGFIVDDVDGAVCAAENVGDLQRKMCRDVFERRFSASRMARDYLTIYQQPAERTITA